MRVVAQAAPNRHHHPGQYHNQQHLDAKEDVRELATRFRDDQETAADEQHGQRRQTP